MCCFYHASNTINLVTATKYTAFWVIEYCVFMKGLIDCSATTHGVIFAKYVAQITKQQGRYAVGHRVLRDRRPRASPEREGRGTHRFGNARKIKSPGHPAPVVRCRTRPRSFANNAQDFGFRLPLLQPVTPIASVPCAPAWLSPPMRLTFVEF